MIVSTQWSLILTENMHSNFKGKNNHKVNFNILTNFSFKCTVSSL